MFHRSYRVAALSATIILLHLVAQFATPWAHSHTSSDHEHVDGRLDHAHLHVPDGVPSSDSLVGEAREGTSEAVIVIGTDLSNLTLSRSRPSLEWKPTASGNPLIRLLEPAPPPFLLQLNLLNEHDLLAHDPYRVLSITDLPPPSA